ncbi:MAG: Ig-like domain-containing protein [Microbacteriaceae bacterium]|uniref:Ig-like domain-containing protein n=1 Tax=Microbacterium sp. TaxID=51671 RepID=UPI003F9D7895
MLGAAALAVVLMLSPSAAFAADDGAADDGVTEAIGTGVQVAFPVQGDTAVYLLGRAAPVSATVTPAGATGIVEFYDGEVLLGSAQVDGEGRAAIETDDWAGSGARSVTARFLPDSSTHLPSASASMTYRVVDTDRMVPDVVVGEPVAEITGATLDWSIANIWFSNFSVGFERQVLSGDITLPESSPGSTLDELRAYYSRPFTFHGGIGSTDAAGASTISFSGSAQLTSGSANTWVFTDPQVLIGADGDGYITAEFSGFYRIGSLDQAYGPVRVAIATFSGATSHPGADGTTVLQTPLNWEGQAGGAGTWANGFDSSFPNEFVALLNPGINLFFAGSGVSTDSSKEPLPITLSYLSEQITAAPVIASSPQSIHVAEGADAAFTVDVAASAPYSVRWQRFSDGDWADIPGAIGERLVIAEVNAVQDGERYRAVVTGDGFELFSEPAVLTVALAAEPPVSSDEDGGDAIEVATGGAADPAGHASGSRDAALATTGAEPATALIVAGILGLIAGGVLLMRRRSARG